MLALIEKQVDFAVEVGKKMVRERVKSVVVKREAVDDFEEYIDVSPAIIEGQGGC